MLLTQISKFTLVRYQAQLKFLQLLLSLDLQLVAMSLQFRKQLKEKQHFQTLLLLNLQH